MSVEILVPIRIESEANRREHHMAKWRRGKKQKEAVALFMRQCTFNALHVTGPLRITMTRIAPKVLDSDNLANGFKAARDQVATELGRNDGDPLIEWKYSQERGEPKQYAARITITPLETKE